MGRAVTGYGRMWIAAAGAACAVALAGCNGAEAGPTPSESAASSSTSTTTTPTGSTTTSSSPTGTATVTIPAAARERTPEGAKAFAVLYYEVLSDSQFRADSSNLRMLSASSCVACQAFAGKADEMKRRGQHVDSRSLKVDEAIVTPTSIRNGFVVDVLAEDRPSKVVDSDGSVVSESRGAKLTFRTQVIWMTNGWKIADSKLVKS